MAAGGGEGLLGLIVVGAGIAAAYGWFSDKSTKLKADEFNQALRKQLGEERQAFWTQSAEERQAFLKQSAEEKRRFEQQVAEVAREVEKRGEYLAALRREFAASYIKGRRWLAHFVVEADKALDESISDTLRSKTRPAMKAAEEVAIARAERRQFKEHAKFLEYQLRSYKEYFPFLEEYEEVILDEAIPLSPNGANLEAVESADPVLLYVPKAEYERLSPADRNQLALERYLSRTLSKAEIGRFYERYLGHLYEKDGWSVEYHGIIEGYEDLGRDLICSRGGRLVIVQAKCWAAEKLIHEKHIFQLFGTTQLYLMNHQQNNLFADGISAEFVTTTSLSPVAKKAAQWLKINVRERFALDKTYPVIKCNINQSSKEKIYHLPFDQQYDRTKIIPRLGEFYASSVVEAERKGFRRAFRHFRT